MTRITKAPEVRRREIVETAERLFREIGFSQCSVEAIIREIGIAKGTFYHHFKSKEDILGAIVERALGTLLEQAVTVADDPSRDALAKFEVLLGGALIGDASNDALTGMMHMPENRELHLLTNIQTVLRLSPILARIVEQGNREGMFRAEHPIETMQVLLTSAQFLLGGGLFDFGADEIRIRRRVAQEIIEKSLAAAPGSFDFMTATPGEG